MTGYHTWAFLFVFCALHLPFFWTGAWTWQGECHTQAGILTFWVIEDFLWFVLNPHFGWSRYRREEIWWHKRWMLGLPVDYWVMSGLGLLLFMVP